MHTISNKTSLRELLAGLRLEHKTIGLVPTMGNLHDGHLLLIKAAKSRIDFVVCTIFVNPLQFAQGEDLEAYPRTLGEDMAKLSSVGCDCLFVPSVEEIYDSNFSAHSIVHVPELAENFCGKSRPGHFDGVTTIVCKLFNLVQPDAACFGLKDYQQYLIVCKMVQDLDFKIDIIGVEIQRESTGLAMSSRNRYLNDEQRQKAALLYQCLLDVKKRIEKGRRDYKSLESAARQWLTESGFAVDYFAVCNPDTLRAAEPLDHDFAILTAAQIGPSRLLDNVRFSVE